MAIFLPPPAEKHQKTLNCVPGRGPARHEAGIMTQQEATPENMTMMQGFEWYVPADQKHWKRLTDQMPQLKAWGIDNIWIPPGYVHSMWCCEKLAHWLMPQVVARAPARKAMGTTYTTCKYLPVLESARLLTVARYDIGEFDQKGGVGTKWGTKEELQTLCRAANDHGVGIYWDAVLNHRFAADHREKCQAVEVDPDDRTKVVSDPYEIDAWVGFDFPGRGDKYSKQKYHWYHFSGVDYNAANKKSAIYKILGEKSHGLWAETPDVDDEKGN